MKINEKEAQKILKDRGPWDVQINGSETVYKNQNGDILNTEGYVETFGCQSGYIELNFEFFEANNKYRGSKFCKLICQSKVSLNNFDFTSEVAKAIMDMWVEAMPIKEPSPQSAAAYTDIASRTDYLLCDRIVSSLSDKSSRIKTKVRNIYFFANDLSKFDWYYEDLIDD